MTKEEIIDFCEMKSQAEPENEDVFNYIIKVLKQEPCDDSISREKVLKEILRLWNSTGDKDYCMETLRDFVSELPPVTPTHKKGKWIMPDKYYDKNIWRKCSVCNTHFEKYNKYISFSGAVTYTEQIANYCKVCGAEMECEDDSN